MIFASSTNAINMFYVMSTNVTLMFGVFVGAILTVLAAFLGLYWGVSKFVQYVFLGSGGSGTTSFLGRHWAFYDRMTYKPYKGYNRLRSRKWNMDHTA